ncbi:drug/metabolite transporter (DMT)-like permease [Saccharothrix tamanrassetensis]|uniref:Drug/metabolite transporter (DMT)-like permease n=1 Tax=Saccharothrix tamanrassetensis TaxID=1051531 RepID=A0A841CCJ8_9PSEU|nr:DMT family transporter [Saccharothrix tamanrassetensis]MBB5956252.1 drug/metabolite transporter (DMT)-like permease [Saccharothrix tamanrassetensis]
MRIAIASGALTSVIVGASVPVTGMLQGYPLLTGQAMRYALGGVVLLGWTLARGGRLAVPARGDWAALCALVVTGMLGFNACVLYAQRYAEPGFVAAVLGASPLVLALVAPVLAGRKPAAVAVVGASVVVAGVVVLSGGGAWHGPGLALAVLTMLGEASFTLFAVGVVRRLGGVAVATWCCFIAAVVGGVLGTFFGGWQVPTVREGAALVVLGTVLTAVAFGLWYFAVAQLGADRAGVLIGLMPVAGLVAAVALGAQELTVVALVGATTVALGCAIGLRGRVSARRAPSAARPVPRPAAPR